MELGSEGETNPGKTSNSAPKNMSNSSEGLAKPKRQMKTPFQLETLEKAYALETYPSEVTRAELSEKLGLSDRQLQMWFCHRRLKDKKETPAKKPRKGAALPLESPGPEPDYGSGSGSGSSPYTELRKVAAGTARAMVEDVPPVRRYYESQQSILELRAIACVEAQLGEPLREDGPILGMEFDPLPPDAFGAPIAIQEPQKRSGHPYEGKAYERHDPRSSKAAARGFHEYPFLPEQSSVRSDAYGQFTQSHFHDLHLDGPRGRTTPFVHGDEPLPVLHGFQGHGSRVRLLPTQEKSSHLSSPLVGEHSHAEREPFANNRITAQSIGHPILGSEDAYMLTDGKIITNDVELRMDRKRKVDESRIAKEVEAHENRIRKELEKLDSRRRKSEERMRKEMERHERERRKEEERLLREKQREEERSQREQRRELERREKVLQKEYLRAEKRRLKEELRREKEAEKRRLAMEKATARRIAKESMDLIEDEQLELMELAAVNKGLPSIIHLDHDTLQNVDSFRDSLRKFPPKSVRLKRPFAIQPWIDSEENVGNLLMVWRFLITFTDVLGLWPFTLDEFIQAFHDFDSRLLGEIHVALLRSIIKDIEDVARTPSTGLGMNQYCAANPEGGHPQIVEGAYTWGFDIRNWQQHLNPLTWPEIFRQLAISAGFGPRLKKRSATWIHMGENDEGKGCQEVVSTLRSGSAAENAFALMREKGLLLPRRSRHRLTPGTVKFAAFHVLSLEGSKGLTVLELADKIQKSGLRDLTTSKTPEASISVALTRDTKLFERIAPSTYCVRAPYRKDPVDAEAILATARKKIQTFDNGYLVGEDAEEVERDELERAEIERDEDSECDIDEDPEVDDIATPSNVNKNADLCEDEANNSLGIRKEKISPNAALNIQEDFEKDFPRIPSNIATDDFEKGFSSLTSDNAKDAKVPVSNGKYTSCADIVEGQLDQQDIEIDESKSGESWVQGLSEGEYSHLSVEERLNALVALIGVANEGNSIRAVLEDRLEAASALKKQMWAEAQLDKSRIKEEYITKVDFSSFTGSKAEAQLANSAFDGNQSPLPIPDNRNIEASAGILDDQKPLLGSQAVQNEQSNYNAERTLALQEAFMGQDSYPTQQHGYASKRSRSQLKSYIAHKAEDLYIYKSLPLGQDRRRNRYWQFVASVSKNDPSSGRIFVELHDGNWRLIDTEEDFDALFVALDTRGIRESHLRIMLQKIETSFKENVRRRSRTSSGNDGSGVDSNPDYISNVDSPSSTACGLNSDVLEVSSCFKVELGRNEKEKQSALKRHEDFGKWIWGGCCNSSTLQALKYGKKRSTQLLAVCDMCHDSYLAEDAHCNYCHQTFSTFDRNINLLEHETHCRESRKMESKDMHVSYSSLPPQIRLLKALCALIEVAVPPEALESFWTEVHRRDWGMRLNASSSAEEIIQIWTQFEGAVKRDCLTSTFETTKELLGSGAQSGNDSADFGSVPVLPWIPQSTAAVGLRVLELDASIMFVKQEKVETPGNKEARAFIKLPSRSSPAIKSKELEVKELDRNEPVKEENFSDLTGRRNSNRRGRGNRNQGSGRKLQRRPGLKYDTSRLSSRQNNDLSLQLRQQGQRTNGHGSGRGRRTVRKRSERQAAAENTLVGRVANVVKPRNSMHSLRLMDDEWSGGKTRVINKVSPDDSNSAEVESDDNEQGEEFERENWEVGFNGASSGFRDPMEVSDEDDEASGYDNDIQRVGGEDSEGDLEMSEGSDGLGNRAGDDEDSDAESEEYSD